MNSSTLIRPAWTPVTIAMMVVGFMIFWPLGLAMIAYILWGDKLDGFKSDMSRAADKANCAFNFGNRERSQWGRTGNVAFDDWREQELERLEEERRKLDEMRHDFDEYLRELRRAKDQEEFDKFMKARKAKGSRPPSSGKVEKK